MMSDSRWVPLFPLNTVLFPGGVLPLRVFEARYIDMVRDCMKQGQDFGVVLIKSGAEVGAAAEPEAIGCLAHITDWDSESAAVLLLRTQGGPRFRVLEKRILPDNRLEARIEYLPDDVPGPVTQIHLECARALKIVIENIDTRGLAEQGAQFASPFSRPPQLEDAGWVANRWSEILPISLKARQKLLELDDAASRVTVIHHYLKQHQIV